MKKSLFVLLAGAALLLLLPVSARAQFRGDVFFATPAGSSPPMRRRPKRLRKGNVGQ
jgi:hypothetical protein